MNVFITGGSSGLGLDLAKLFFKDGNKVGVCAIETYDQVKEAVPNPIAYYQVNVIDKEAVSNAINDFAQKNNGLDIVVANAGISMPKARIPDFDRGRLLIETNVIGMLNTFEPAIKIMKEQGRGHLVSMASIAGTIGLPGTAIYGASKSAVINLCESFEIDLYKYGIHVTTMAPGFIDTPLTKANKHKMPLLMPQEKAVRLIYKAILKRKGLYIFPLRMKIISRILYHLPRGLYKYFMKKDPLGLAND